MADTIALNVGDHTSDARPALGIVSGIGWVSCVVDATAVTTAQGAATAGTIASGSTVTLFHLPAGACVLDFVVDVNTIEGGTLTVDIGPYTHSTGDAIDADGFIDGLNCNSATGLQRVTRGILMSDSDLPTGSKGSWSAEDVAADIKAYYNNAADKAKITVYALVAYPK